MLKVIHATTNERTNIIIYGCLHVELHGRIQGGGTGGLFPPLFAEILVFWDPFWGILGPGPPLFQGHLWVVPPLFQKAGSALECLLCFPVCLAHNAHIYTNPLHINTTPFQIPDNNFITVLHKISRSLP